MKANVAIIIAMAQLFAIDAQLIPLGPSIPITLSSNQTLTFIQEYRKVRVSIVFILLIIVFNIKSWWFDYFVEFNVSLFDFI